MNNGTKQPLAKLLTVDEFDKRYSESADQLISLAVDLAATLEARPEFADELVNAGYTRDLIRRLERIGRGEVHPKLAFAVSAGHRKLSRCTYSEQSLALERGLEVLAPDFKEHRLIAAEDLSKEQIGQVFAGRRIRSLAEQRTWLEEYSRHHAADKSAAEGGWQIEKHGVKINRPMTIPRTLLLQWLAELG